jgi:hypothetical protein
LKHWVVSYEPINWQQEDQPPFWTINEKRQLECFGGALYGHLIYRYPMPMNSSIKVTADLSDKKTDGLYCGGVSMMSFDEQQGDSYAMASNVRVLGQFRAHSAKPSRMLEGTFNDSSLTLKCGDKTIEVLDYGAKTVPFVGLASYGAKQSAYSEIALSAPGAIPREVALLDEGLTGWSAYLFGHMLPKLPGYIETDASDTQLDYSAQDTAPPMWSLVDNEIRAGKVKSGEDDAKSAEETEEVASDEELAARNATTSQSNLSYCRPLCEGERFEYEFFHQPGVQNASPSVGRIAYMIRDGKISLRWISITEARKPNTESNNFGDDPAAEVLAPIMLEVNAWNRAQLRIEGGKVVLSVAGTDVYRRPLEKDTVARFGFYCDPTKDQVRVRNVVLKGDWPSEVPTDLWELK